MKKYRTGAYRVKSTFNTEKTGHFFQDISRVIFYFTYKQFFYIKKTCKKCHFSIKGGRRCYFLDEEKTEKSP